MASSKDFEQLWQNYQAQSRGSDISIVDYVQRNGVVYGQFERWYKKHVGGVSIIPVSSEEAQREPASVPRQVSSQSQPFASHVPARVVFVNIEFSNGLKVCQKSIDYVQLRLLVEKLEALC